MTNLVQSGISPFNMIKFWIVWPTFFPLLLQYNIFSCHTCIISPFQHVCFVYACMLCVRPVSGLNDKTVTLLWCRIYQRSCTVFFVAKYSTVLRFTANVTLLLRLNNEFDDIWTSCGLRRRFRRSYGDFGFYDHLNKMTKMVWSLDGYMKRRQVHWVKLWNKIPKLN